MNDYKKEKLKDEPRPQPDIEWTEMTRALAQVVLGNLMVVLGAGSFSYWCYLCYVSAGIWVGFTVLATGLLGVIEASRESYSLRRSYVIMLIITTVLSMTLFGVEVAGYVFDSQGCDKPFRNMTSTAPPPMSPSTPGWYTHHPPPQYSYCIMECVYIHAGLGTFGILQFAAAVVCIYYTSQSLMKVAPLPYKAMPEPVPYCKA